METKTFVASQREIKLHTCHTLVIGSGAAALNCADHLYDMGVTDILIVTERLGGGTSANSGSDKQTYYKLSLFGEAADSTYEMARTLYQGGAMHGDIALVEATLSPQEFFHLVQIGVPFPHNEFGGYVGYKTDHDPKQRATSAGPWTSQQMYEKLLVQVQKKGIPILDGHEVISLIVTEKPEGPRVVGALALDKGNINEDDYGLVLLQAENIVMGTGGPGGLFQSSVYPIGHLGSTGIAIAAGAAFANMTEWQFGLASTKFRWNVSGTYQQVIPRYISTAPDGSDEQQFLNKYFPSMGKLATNIFLKGYQWPFDPRKLENLGSSIIDVLVYIETVVKGRRVFMDFRRNPGPGDGLGEFSFDDLEPEAYEYLKRSEALLPTPIERLKHMNQMAIDLYKQNGIDIEREPLEIAVCAQHCNGGLQGNIWWESNVRHLFPVGEVNGTHGVYRPGGSALNSGQAGSYRAAQYIAARYNERTVSDDDFHQGASKEIERIIGLAGSALRPSAESALDNSAFRKKLQERMTRSAAHIRQKSEVAAALEETRRDFAALLKGQVNLNGPSDLLGFFQNIQLTLTALAMLESIKTYLEAGGGSRGSYLVLDPSGEPVLDDLGDQWRFLPEKESLRSKVLVGRYNGGTDFTVGWEPVRPIPEDDFWFENVWNAYVRGEVFDDRK